MNSQKLSDISNALIQGLVSLETKLSAAANEYARNMCAIETAELFGNTNMVLPKEVFFPRFDRAVAQFNMHKQELFRNLVQTYLIELRNESQELYEQWFDGVITHEEYITLALDYAMLNDKRV